MTEVPNQYFLQGGGISVAYSPQGFGPLRLDLGLEVNAVTELAGTAINGPWPMWVALAVRRAGLGAAAGRRER
jgi:hypothetical protein